MVIYIHKLTYKNYITFSLFIFIFASFLYLFLVFIFDIPVSNDTSVNLIDYGFQYSLSIIVNNLRNFFQYILFFFISPLLIIIDLFILVYQMWLGINVHGGESVFLLLYRHGIIEFPNMILYMLLSLKCMYIFYKRFSLDDVFAFMRNNYKLYLFSIINVIIAGLIEGMVNF